MNKVTLIGGWFVKVEREINFLIITGMSDAGKTVAIQSLED